MNSMMQMQMAYGNYYNYAPKPQHFRNRRVITQDESKEFVIDINNLVDDGRTTVMIRNIPNKYSQPLLLALFQQNHKRKFDFFYLPIDPNVKYIFM